jgi:IS30 family transposase
MKMFFIAIALLQTPEVTEVANMEECKALMKEVKIAAFENDSDLISEFAGTLTVTKDLKMSTYYCGAPKS